MSKESEVKDGLVSALRAVTGLPDDIVYPNESLDPTGEHLRVFFNGIQPRSASLGCDALQGFMQVSIYTEENIGAKRADDIVDLLAEAFPRYREITAGTTRITITKQPWASGSSNDGKFSHTPVTIEYEAKT